VVTACPLPEDREAFARSLGYATAMDCDREHDPLHVRVCALLGQASPTLRWVATGGRAPVHPDPDRNRDALGWEESLVLGVQKWLNTGECNGDIRVLWWLGFDPDQLRGWLRP
jgi:hypothetical protein